MDFTNSDNIDVKRWLRHRGQIVHTLLGSTAVAAMCALSNVAQGQETDVFLDVIAQDGDAAPGASGVFTLPFSVGGTDAPLIDDSGNVYFYSETTDAGLPSLNFSGIWTGNGGGLMPIAVEGQALPGFELTAADCTGLGPTCGELFNVQDIFNVSPDGETIFRASRDEGLDGTLAIFSRVGTNPAAALLTLADDGDFDDGRVSRVTRDGVYFIGDFVGTAPFGSGPGGSLIDGELTNYIDPLIGGAAPGVSGSVTIDNISGVSVFNGLDPVNERADILYQAELSDGATALYLNPSASGAANTVVLLTGDTAPGLADGKFIGIDIADINDNGQGFVRASWNELADPAFGDAREGLWRFDDTGNLELVASNRNDLDDAIFTVAGFGAQEFVFSNLVNFTGATIAPNGDVYFFATADLVNSSGVALGEEISGLWRSPATGGSLELMLQQRDSDDSGTSLLGGDVVAGFDLGGSGNDGFGFDADGNLIISINARATDGTTSTGLYVFTTDDEVLLIAEQGQEIEVSSGVNRTIADLSFNTREFVGGTLASFRNDNFAFNVEFTDDSVAVVQARLQGAMVIVTDFTWSGACGNTDWHAGCAASNWNDPDSDAANLAPGDENGTESAAINNADVVISARAVDLEALNTTGSLAVQQSLTLRNASTIENLILSDTLISGGETVLSGAQNSWTDGTISGAGQVSVGAGSTLTITPDNTSVDLETTLAVTGTAVQTGGTLNLLGASALIDINGGGTYEIQAGIIVDDTVGTTVKNSGTLLKTGDGVATINAGFENDSMGEVRVQAGTLQFTDASSWTGDLRVQDGAIAEIAGSTANFGSVSGNFTATGEGILRLSDATITLGAGAQTLLDFSTTAGSGASPAVEVTNGTTFSGTGTLNNDGQMHLVGEGISFANGLTFENSGALTKTGAGTTTFNGNFSNAGPSLGSLGGRVEVREGMLVFNDPSTWGGDIDIDAGAAATFVNTVTTLGLPSGANFIATGEGLLRFDRGEVIIGSGAETQFNITGEDGAVQLDGGVTLGGAGTIRNQGQLRVNEATIESTFINEGAVMLAEGAQLFLSESIGTLTNNGTFEITGTGQSIIDGPFDTVSLSAMRFENNGDITVTSGDMLFRFTTLALNNGSSIFAADGSEAAFQEAIIEVSGQATLSGAGTISLNGNAGDDIVSVQILENATLTNAVSGGLLFENALPAGLRVAPETSILGTGTLSNIGGMTFAGGEISVDEFVNEAAGQLVIGGSADGMRLLRTTLQNDASVIQTSELMLSSQGRIENATGDYRFVDGADILLQDTTATATNAFINTGRILVSGSQTSTLGVKLENAADIEISGGTLTLSRGGEFKRNAESLNGVVSISLENGGGLTLGGDDPTRSYVFFEGTTEIVGALGDGMFTIAGAPTNIGIGGTRIRGDQALRISASAQWTSGDIILLRDDDFSNPFDTPIQIGGDAGPGQLNIKAGAGTLFGGEVNAFGINSNGIVHQETDLNILSSVNFSLAGLYVLDGNLVSAIDDDLNSFNFSQGGTLRVSESKSVTTDAALTFDPDASDQTVEVQNNASLTLPRVRSDAFQGLPSSINDVMAISGNWILGENAKIIDSSAASAAFTSKILAIATPITLNNGSEFFNLPNVDGDLEILEGGRLTLNNINLDIEGDFSVADSATLTGLNAVIDVEGTTTLGFGALFSGDGITVNSSVRVEGTQDIGMSPGTMTINGDYTLAETGTLQIELGGLEPATTYDQLIINGGASFEQGAQVVISVIDPDLGDDDDTIFAPASGDTFDILIADSIDLSSQQLDDILAFSDLPTGLSFEFSLVSLDDATVLQLSAIFGSSLLEVPDLTVSQNALAGVLDTVSRSGTSEQITTLALGLDGLASDQAKRGALDQVNHSFATTFVDLARTAARTSHAQITNRLDSLIWQETVIDGALQQSSLALAASGAPASVPGTAPALDISGADHLSNYASAWLGSATAGEATLMDRNGIRVFVSAAYERGDFGATQNQTGFDYDGRTGTVGLEYASANGAWMVGVAGIFSSFDGDADLSRGSIDADSRTISGYGFVKAGPAVFDAVLSYGSMDQETERRVSVADQAFTAAAETDADFLSVTARISAPFERGKLRFGPVAAISYTDIDVDGFNESGAGQTGLMLADQSAQYSAAQVGGRILMRYQAGDWRIEPRVTAALHHAFVNDAPTVDAQFIGALENPFAIPTEAIEDTSLSLDAGVTFYSKGRFNLSADYNGFLLNSDTVQHSISARLAARF